MFKRNLGASFAAFGLVAALSSPVLAPSASAATAQCDVQAGNYKIETTHTQVAFSLLHFGFTNYSGLFSGATGTLSLDPAHPTNDKLNVAIPVASVQTTSDKLTDELKGADWFDTAKYPNATFVSTKVVPNGKGKATVTGDFTLHGVTKPIVLHVSYIGAGINPLDKAYTVGFHATGIIKRSDFGVKAYVPMVGDDVTLSIAGAFEKQG
ncbi:YceI family protein [Kozakia baliensis]|uniref:YceI family protein n=1 Tax=Kozakia baliensis TaxID=153496 RepID=UPI00087BEA8D|nr:YceI family protein [Kozakia baliensis]AOX20761.1 polyisoprenoid-binding protein [Kozakia baliensis]